MNQMTPQKAAEIEARLEVMRGDRSCGPCNACCTVMGVEELQKLNYQRCCHLAANCTIYQSRPVSCRIWSCSWLLGLEPGGDDRHRPDQLGLIFTREPVDSLGDVHVAYEVWLGASEEPKGACLLEKLAKNFPIIVLSDNRGKVVGADAADAARIMDVFIRHRQGRLGCSSTGPDGDTAQQTQESG